MEITQEKQTDRKRKYFKVQFKDCKRGNRWRTSAIFTTKEEAVKAKAPLYDHERLVRFRHAFLSEGDFRHLSKNKLELFYRNREAFSVSELCRIALAIKEVNHNLPGPLLICEIEKQGNGLAIILEGAGKDVLAQAAPLLYKAFEELASESKSVLS